MDPDRLVLLQGLRDTRSTFARWRADPKRILVPWTLGALAIALALLTVVWIIAAAVQPDPSTTLLPGLNTQADLGDVGRILFRNSLVLALHAFACVAGFIAGASLPLQVEHKTGFSSSPSPRCSRSRPRATSSAASAPTSRCNSRSPRSG
jgi:hypothetical protein